MKRICRGLAFCLLFGLASSLLAQNATEAEPNQSAFEVASLRSSPVSDRSCYTMSPEGGVRFTLTCASLRLLIAMAYETQVDRIKGRDLKLDGLYDLQAKIPGDKPWTYEEIPPMLRTLLRERFHLALHKEMREVDGYELIVGKNGQKMKASTLPSEAGSQDVILTSRLVKAQNISADDIAKLLANSVARPVVNHTKLMGNYTLNLHFSTVQDIDSSDPIFFTAVEEQLGLKLNPIQVPVDFFIIDHIDPNPIAN